MRSDLRAKRLAALLWPLVAAGCGGDGGDRSASELAAAGAAPAEISAPALWEAALPAPGEVTAWQDAEGRIRVVAREAPRGAILAAIAEAAEFGTMIGVEADLDRRLTLRVSGEPLEVALAQVLAGVSHALEYAADGGAGAQRLALVAVGRAPAPAGGRPARVETADSRATRAGPALARAEDPERAERARRLWSESLENLESADPELRADGARWLDVSSAEGFEAAVERLENDASPEVRRAAAETLIDADAGAVPPLVQALGDPDPHVVVAALEALEFVGDESTVPHLAALLEHRDADVRERTREAIEYLQ